MRVVAALLLVPLVVLAAGCGDDEPDTVTGGAGTAPTVDVQVPDPLRVGPVTWTVTVANGESEAVVLEFGSSKRADVTLTRDGEEVYRWSRGLMFTQALGEERLAAGEERAYRLDEPGLDVDPGEYRLTASVAVRGREGLAVSRTVTVLPMR